MPRLLLALLVLGLAYGFSAGPALAQAEQLVTTPAELTLAIAEARPGDTIVMADGTWRDLELRFFAEGVEGDTITLRAQTPGRVVLSGNSRLRIGGSYLKVDGLLFRDGFLPASGGHVVEFRASSARHAHHSRLTNTAIIDYNPPSSLTESKYVSVYGTHNRVDHSHFEGKTNDGATLVVWVRPESGRPEDQVPNHNRIDRNYFGPRPDLGRNGGETIRIGTSDWSLFPSFTTVERNLFDRCDGEIEIISNKSGDNVFRYNTFLESAGTLTLRHGDRALVEGNYFFGNRKASTGGIRIIGEDHVVVNNYLEGIAGTASRAPISIMNGVPDSPLNRYFQVQRAVVAHNTIVNSRTAIEIGSGRSSELSLPPDDLLIANNVVSNLTTPRSNLVVARDQATGLVWQGNVFFGGGLGIAQADGIALADPLLVEGEDGQHRPDAESPARGAAVGRLVEDDVEGRVRPDPPAYSGAHEPGGEPITRGPLGPRDVGPTWDVQTTRNAGGAGASPDLLELGGVHPNPFRGSGTVRFTLGAPADVRVEVFDLLGRRVALLHDGPLPPGVHAVRWDGRSTSPGTYLYRVRAGAAVQTGRAVRLR